MHIEWGDFSLPARLLSGARSIFGDLGDLGDLGEKVGTRVGDFFEKK